MESPTMIEKKKGVCINAFGYPQPAISLLCLAADWLPPTLKQSKRRTTAMSRETIKCNIRNILSSSWS